VESPRSSQVLRSGSRIGALRRFAAPPPARTAPEERCELCDRLLPPRHRHLLETERRTIRCACDGCALRFDGVIGGRFALIPRDARRLPDFQMSDQQWAGFSLPIDLAFLSYHTPAAKMVALYPGAAGAVESLLTLSTWSDLVTANPELADLKPDVEALLVNRCGTARDYYLAPIDACFELVGLIRMHWSGLSGGSAVWREISGFFQGLDPSMASGSSGVSEVACA
jgi:hypothetical protein